LRNNKIIKLAALNIGIALSDIVVFSQGILHVSLIGAGAFQAAVGGTAILMSAVVFAYGNYKLLNEKAKLIQTSEIKTPEDCINALKQNYSKKTFTKDTDTILEQISRFQKKKETVNDILLQKFSSTELSYSKFQTPLLGLENVFYLNVKSILNKLNAFDEDDYNNMQKDSAKAEFSKEFIDSKMSIFNEYISFVKNAVEENEEILLKLDKLLLEISKFNSLDGGEIQNMSAMKEIDDLIKNTKWYK